MAETRITGIIESSLEQVRNVVDANTIIGDPISTPGGVTVIPVSKVMVGFASGGIDYLGKNMKRVADSSQGQRPTPLTTNFGGGGGTGVTVQPVGFLVISPDGNVQLLNVGAGSAGSGDKIESLTNLLEKTPEVLSKIKAIFSKKKDDCAEDEKAADKAEKTDSKE